MKQSLLTFAVIFALLINVFGQQQRQTPSSSPQQTPQTEPPSAPQPTPPAAPLPTPDAQIADDSDDVVRITTNLVQVDATVTDRDGKQVTDLKAEDFEILENGKPQPIKNFSYVTTYSVPTADATAAGAPAKTAPTAKDRAAAPPAVPMNQLRPEQVKRALALVVDDLRMSAEAISMTKQALRKFVDTQTQPGDLVAIIRTSGGMGALQQFTTDREQLYAAIDHVRQIARAGGRPGAFSSVNMLDRMESQTSIGMANENTESEADRRNRESSLAGASQSSLRGVDQARVQDINEFRDTLFAVGTLGALNFVVRGLRDLPGRKAVVLFSDGISIFSSDASAGDRNERVLEALRQLVDRANRASVVFYAIDTRGLQPDGVQAADNTSGGALVNNPGGGASSLGGVGTITPDRVGTQVLGGRSAEMFEGQNGLSYLARNTGGLAVFNNNDLNLGIRKALNDIGGYYLIGYRPDESTFDPSSGLRRFNTWTIKLKNHPNLKVRTRSGFINVEDKSRNKKRTPGEELMAALASPFSARGINLQLSSFFLNDATIGSTMRSVILMDADKLTFTKQPDGRQQTVLNIIGVTLGDSGQVVDRTTVVEKISVSPENLERFRREGMVYGFNIPISKPGAYLLRVAVRDAASSRIGSASQFVEVPDVNKDRLTLSSLVIAGNNPEGTGAKRTPTTTTDLLKTLLARRDSASPSTSPPSPASALVPGSGSSGSSTSSSGTPSIVAGGEGMIGTEDAQAGPASRRFRTRMFLNYACVIYNAKNDKAQHTNFTSQVRLFHDGQEVFAGKLEPLDMKVQKDMTRLVVSRRVYLGTILTPGDYVLHVTVTEPAASGSPRTATRWIDFRIVD